MGASNGLDVKTHYPCYPRVKSPERTLHKKKEKKKPRLESPGGAENAICSCNVASGTLLTVVLMRMLHTDFDKPHQKRKHFRGFEIYIQRIFFCFRL